MRRTSPGASPTTRGGSTALSRTCSISTGSRAGSLRRSCNRPTSARWCGGWSPSPDPIADSRLRTDIASVTVAVDAASDRAVIENLLANTVRHTPNELHDLDQRSCGHPDGVLLLVGGRWAGRRARSSPTRSSNRSGKAPTRPSTRPGSGRADARPAVPRSSTAAGRGSRSEPAAAPRSACSCRPSPAGRRNARRPRRPPRRQRPGGRRRRAPPAPRPPANRGRTRLSVNHFGVDRGELLPLAGDVVLVEDRGHRAAPARTRRSRRTRPAGCRASAGPRRCSRPGTRRRRRGPSRRCTALQIV